MKTSKKIAKQIFKEFWLPSLVAIIWLVINISIGFSSTDNNFIKYINVFFPGFFFASYFTGQYHRVKKQIKVEDNLSTVEDKLIKLTSELEIKTTNLLNHLTGGDNFFYYRFEQNISPENWFLIRPILVEDYPINNIRIMFLSADSNYKEHMFEIKNITKSTSARGNSEIQLRFDANNRYMTSIVFTADNKNWVQIITAAKRDFEVSIKTEVYVNGLKKHEEQYLISVYDFK